jgi:four helix bundle protein
MGTVLNLAESTARMTHSEKKQYLTLARGNINACVALMELAKELDWMDQNTYEHFYGRYEQMSKMMLGMIRSFSSDSHHGQPTPRQ